MYKTKRIKKFIKDDELGSLFAQMLGTSKVNMDICYPKYESIRECFLKILKVLKMFSQSPFLCSFDELEDNRREIDQFVSSAIADTKHIFRFDFSKVPTSLNLLDDKTRDEFTDAYNELKKLQHVHDCIKIANNLVHYRKHVGVRENLNHRFVNTIPGNDFTPLPMTNLNFKWLINIMAADSKELEIKFIMTVLNKLYELSLKLYKAFIQPDVDIDEFVRVIINNMTELKKYVPRCDRAFKVIENSVKLLKDNFNEYYKDFIESRDQTIIMQNFISDITGSLSNMDADLSRQFRQIINFYQERAREISKKDPKIQKLFEKADEMQKMMGIHGDLAENLEAAEDADESDDDSDGEPPDNESAENNVNAAGKE